MQTESPASPSMDCQQPQLDRVPSLAVSADTSPEDSKRNGPNRTSSISTGKRIGRIRVVRRSTKSSSGIVGCEICVPQLESPDADDDLSTISSSSTRDYDDDDVTQRLLEKAARHFTGNASGKTVQDKWSADGSAGIHIRIRRRESDRAPTHPRQLQSRHSPTTSNSSHRRRQSGYHPMHQMTACCGSTDTTSNANSSQHTTPNDVSPRRPRRGRCQSADSIPSRPNRCLSPDPSCRTQ